MKRANAISILLNTVFVILVLLFLLDAATPLEVKSQFLKSLGYQGMLFGTPLLLILNLLLVKERGKKLAALMLPLLSSALIVAVGPLKILVASAAWRTQTVLYQHKEDSSRKIEFQMQDAGALGFNRRTVEVQYLTGFFTIVRPAPEPTPREEQWAEVNEDVNELRLKAP